MCAPPPPFAPFPWPGRAADMYCPALAVWPHRQHRPEESRGTAAVRVCRVRPPEVRSRCGGQASARLAARIAWIARARAACLPLRMAGVAVLRTKLGLAGPACSTVGTPVATVIDASDLHATQCAELDACANHVCRRGPLLMY